jgi:hypothetical protein
MPTDHANASMSLLLEAASSLALTDLDSELLAYVNDGLVVLADGSLVSAAALPGARADRHRFADRVEYEAFVNKIHIDDWSSEALANAPIVEKLAHAILLADRVGELAEQRGIAVAVDRRGLSGRGNQ